MTRRLLWIAVVGAIVFAGCMGGPGSGPDSAGPAADGAANVSSADVPGLTDDSLANATALAAATESALESEGGALRVSWETAATDTTFQVVTGAGFETYSLSGAPGSSASGPANVSLWSNESTRFVRTTADGTESYRAFDRRDERPTGVGSIADYLEAGDFTVATETTGNGTVVLTADEVVPPADGHGPLADATALDGRLVVTESGLVQNLTVDATVDGEPHTYRFAVTRTGVDRVSPPAWVGDLPPGATLQPHLTIDVENSSYLALRHEGGDAVPSDAVVAVTANGTSGQAALESPLEAGGTRYVYVDEASGEISLAGNRPNATVVDPVESPVSITVTTEGGSTLHSSGMSWETASATAEAPGSESESTGSSGGGASGGGASSSTSETDAASER